jgi:hypothetical protein
MENIKNGDFVELPYPAQKCSRIRGEYPSPTSWYLYPPTILWTGDPADHANTIVQSTGTACVD